MTSVLDGVGERGLLFLAAQAACDRGDDGAHGTGRAPRGSHSIYVSQPRATADLIKLAAARARVESPATA